MAEKTKILVMAEGVTLAHVGRSLVVAKALIESGYDITFACDKRFLSFVDAKAMRYVPITSIDSKEFLKRVTWGKPLFTTGELKAAVEEDLRLLDDIRPALVIGDLRWSLSVSARLRKISYAAISNAYWSPYAAHQDWVLPAHPIFQHFGFSAMQCIFRLARPIAFASLTLPSNHVRKHYGLPPIGRDYRKLHEDADFVLFPDMPELYPTRNLPPTHHYIGPIQWSPSVPLPEWWGQLRGDVLIIYVNLGSSGKVGLLPMILETLAALPVQVIAATAGRSRMESPTPTVFLADYLPGDECMKRAALAITNGGSMSGYQALAAGVPVLAMVSLMDQHLSMQPIVAAGAGVLVCSPYVTPQMLLKTVRHMCEESSFKCQGQRLQQSLGAAFDVTALVRIIESMLPLHAA